MIGERVSGGRTGDTRADRGAQPNESCWTPRALLLGPALVQLVVAYLFSRDLRAGGNAPAVLVPLILLALGGAGGIVAGVFGRSRRLFHLGILCALVGFALPVALNAAATPINRSTALLPVLGDFDAEALGTLLFMRMVVELPFWGLYGILGIVGHLGSRRAENGTAVSNSLSGPPRR